MVVPEFIFISLNLSIEILGHSKKVNYREVKYEKKKIHVGNNTVTK